ncbi:MAG: alpha-amylase/4-alpha-glucanotransferase domain-containing protein [Terriglobales bacterium]
MPLALALVLHAHQPVGNFDDVIEQAYASAYLPFLEAAAERPWFHLNLHFTGFLLDWLAQRHPDYLDLLRRLHTSGRLELLGGGYYEPILAALRPADQQEQLARLRASLEQHFGAAPRGAWLAERVWEPDLPAVLAEAGLAYVLLDDSHLQAAGVPASGLHGYWLTEAQGRTVAVIPSNYFLRQALPFRPVAEGLEFLSAAAGLHAGSLLTMGDDLEKFGSWPHTARHVYAEGWLRDFLDALEASQDRVRTVRLSDYLDHHAAQGLVYIPSASYPEMMRWAGSPAWRGFLTKYSEANLLHKSQLDLTTRWREFAASASPAAQSARDHLLAAQCNDVYWHGWFGGVYSPHLRQVAFANLLAADAQLEQLAPAPRRRRFDLLCTGRELVEMRSSQLRLLLAPADGATVLELDALAAHANLINSIERRPEPYHDEIRSGAAVNPGQLPGEASAPTADLASRLRYDDCAPNGARLYLDGIPDRAPYDIVTFPDGRKDGLLQMRSGAVSKCIRLRSDTVACELDGLPASARLGLAWVFNLLAPDAPDRGLLHAGRRSRLDWLGELPPGPVTLCDGWRRLHIELLAEAISGWLITPRYSISRSEQGYEALYQGSEIRALWPPGTDSIRSQVKIFPCQCRF